MKLLIVDDEKYVIESIKRNICWNNTQVSEIYTAFSMKQAQEIIAVSDIDVIISDIVMPGATGFDFVEWIRDQNIEVQVIFLTSYAEFDYARRAIQLKSVEYLLKPINYGQLEDAIKKAEKAAQQEKKRKILEKENSNWKKNRIILQQDIWKNLLNRSLPEEKFYETAQRRNLNYEPKQVFKLLCFCTEEKEMEQKKWDMMTLEFVIQNVLAEFYEKATTSVDTVFYENKKQYWIVVLTQNKTENIDELEEKQILEKFIQWINEHIYSRLWCGMGVWEDIPMLSKQYEKLQRMREGSLSVWNEVLYLSQFQVSHTVYENTELEVWKALLAEENADDLIARIREHIDEEQRKGMITRDFLCSLRMDLMQMVYSWLSERGIKAYALFSDIENEILVRNAVDGGKQMMEYSKNLVRKAIEYRKYVNKTDSVANQICMYIDAHYQEEIHRDQLAELVFLNTDYMSRIFKKEKGISISTYILQKRVDEAKKLLVQSNLPINTVSLYVGYSNFSYFTKMFKENTGYTPLEYRRKVKKGDQR